jgi:adenosylcobinamide-GDP ribazoletransferase
VSRRLRAVARIPSEIAHAVAFLTIVPLPGALLRRGGFGGAVAWFPLVGVLVGGLAGAVRVALEPLLGAAAATVVAVAALVIVTGALHQDGLADSADGLGVRGDRERRLAVMRDSAIGAFGTLALLGWALLLVATLAAIDATQALRALIAAAALGRAAALVHGAATPPARPEGLGAGFAVGRLALAVGSVVAAGAAVAAAGPLRGLAAIATAAVLALGSIAWARRAVGGRTGDTLGATIALTELAVCLVLTASWHG